MSTETANPNYKIGNERLIRVTDKAANRLASLLEKKGNPNGALRLARHSRPDLERSHRGRSEKRALC